MCNLIKVILCSCVCLFLTWSSAYSSEEERAVLSERPKKLVVDVINNDDSSSSGQWGKVLEETALEAVGKKKEKKRWSFRGLFSYFYNSRKVAALDHRISQYEGTTDLADNNTNSTSSVYSSSVSVKDDCARGFATGNNYGSGETPRIFTPIRSKRSATYKVFIAGGGGLGCFVAHLLSKISGDGVIFDIVIGEKGSNILDESTFSLASIVHTGYEYLQCKKTIAACQMGSKLWGAIWGDFYSDKKVQGTLFARDIDAPEDFNLANQKAAYKEGKSLSREIMVSHSGECDLDAFAQINLGSDSHDDILPETMQKTFGVLTTGKYSKDDFSMNILTRNYHLKRQIQTLLNVSVVTDFELLRILSGKEKRFCVEGNTGVLPDEYDFVVLTPWDQIRKILGQSVHAEESMSHVPEFIIEKRYMALVGTKGLGEMNMQVMTQGAGCMLSQVNEDMANAYECSDGASYPGETGDAMVHGQNIMKGLQRRLGINSEMELLGVRCVNIVRSNQELHTRNNVQPFIIPADVPNIGGVISGVAMKATLIPSVAFQTVDMLVSQLPDSPHKENMLKKLRDIVPNNECLYTGMCLPEDFIIDTQMKPTKVELLEETLIYMRNFELTEAGRKLKKHYSDELRACGMSKRMRSSTLQTPSSPVLTYTTPPTMRRAISDGESLDLFYSPALKMSIRAASAKLNMKLKSLEHDSSEESDSSERSTLVFPSRDLVSAETSVFSTDDDTNLVELSDVLSEDCRSLFFE